MKIKSFEQLENKLGKENQIIVFRIIFYETGGEIVKARNINDGSTHYYVKWDKENDYFDKGSELFKNFMLCTHPKNYNDNTHIGYLKYNNDILEIKDITKQEALQLKK